MAGTICRDVYYKAFLCETNIYVDIGGTLTDITPVGGLSPPVLPTIGGYGDGLYNADVYGTPRAAPTIIPIDQLPGLLLNGQLRSDPVGDGVAGRSALEVGSARWRHRVAGSEGYGGVGGAAWALVRGHARAIRADLRS